MKKESRVTQVMMSKEQDWLLKEKYHGVKTDEYFLDLKRIENGEPIAYVIGFSVFLGCHIDLSYKPLIPRVETEYWVEKAIKEIKTIYKDKKIKCLDIFSGSGCIGISVLKHIPNSNVVFSDIDENMITQIKKNLDVNNINPDRYEITQSDIFSNLNSKFDVVFANPPYIDISRNTTDESVMNNEPHLALFSKKNGLEIIEKFIRSMQDHLEKNYIVYIEHDDDQVSRIKNILLDNHFFEFSFQKDQYSLDRFVVIKNSAK